MTDIRTKALKLLRSSFFFSSLLTDIRRAGLIGEERNALVVYLVATSRLLSDPLALFIKGQSGIGKNHLADTVLKFIPPTQIRQFSSASRRAWNYQGNLAHTLVYENERNEGSGPVDPLRVLLSAKELISHVTVQKGHRTFVQRVVTQGPIAAISTTTQTRLEVDDETRHLSLWLDESSQQTFRIIAAAVENELDGKAFVDETSLAVWHDVQHLLKGRSSIPILFPRWLRQLPESVQTDSLWARRYFSAFLRTIKTVALIRSFRWTRHELNRKGKILVYFSDLATATIIFGPVFAHSLRHADDIDIEIRNRVACLSAARDDAPVSASDVSENMGLSMDKAYGLLRKAERSGTIRKATSAEKFNRKLFLPAEIRGFLPEPDAMFRGLTEGPKTVKFVHPITGKWVTYEREPTALATRSDRCLTKPTN